MDAKAFLHYMQFLVSLVTRLVTPMNAAFFKLIDFLDKCDNHFETSMNLSAHCLSLVNLKPGALHMLRESLSIFSINNAANLHVCLLLFSCVCDVLCGLDLFLLMKSRCIVPRNCAQGLYNRFGYKNDCAFVLTTVYNICRK